MGDGPVKAPLSPPRATRDSEARVMRDMSRLATFGWGFEVPLKPKPRREIGDIMSNVDRFEILERGLLRNIMTKDVARARAGIKGEGRRRREGVH